MVNRHEESQPLMTDSDRDSDAQGAKFPRTTTRPTNASASSDDIDVDHPDAPVTNAAAAGNGQGAVQLEVVDDDRQSGASTPRFLQDEDSWKRWRWVPYPVRRVVKAVNRWSHGPSNPQPYRIKPFFPAVQTYPLWLVDRFLPRRRQRFWVLFAYFSAWLIGFVLLKRQETLAIDIEGWGTPRSIGCGVTYWARGNGCSLDGNNCRPFTDTGFPFSCHANCESYHVLNPRAVGDQEVIYQPLVVGGPSDDNDRATYRGDSFICGAAIHAGVITDSQGGCGVVELVGQQENFESSTRHGIKSIAFDSYFPLSFRFVENIKCGSTTDMRWSILGLSATFTGVLSLFTSSAALFFFPNFIAIFWTVGMALDPPNISSVTALFSNILGKFLPAMFVAWVMYDKMGIRRTLGGLKAQIEKTILWLGACWVGAMDNYTLSFIPIQRLTGHDLQQQPGAKAALAIIVIVLVAIVAAQVWFFQQEGRFRKYIKLYGLFIAAIVISLTLPGLNLRIHHYIIALLLLPGTSLQMRPSLLYQGLLVGLFINGIARWGFDPVLQTPDALQGDAQLGTALPIISSPTINLSNATNGISNITFEWDPPPVPEWDGISILVNDVERFRTYFTDIGAAHNFVWHRNSTLDLPEYFRFAFVDGSEPGDYTKAGKWTKDGEWVEMEPGPSKIKARGLDKDELLQR
jgi:hypothetical protein